MHRVSLLTAVREFRVACGEPNYFSPNADCPRRPRPCKEKDRLKKSHIDTLKELVEATILLYRAPYGQAFLEALAKTQQARTKCEGAKMALHRHREEHGC